MEHYLCPNDRQLALRARLGTGWSSRAHSLKTRPVKRLSSEEEDHIMRVVQRNEHLQENEKHRVDYMFQRLRRMKQDAVNYNRSECSICKQEFGRLTKLPSICSECGRYVCGNCFIEKPISRKTTRLDSSVDKNWLNKFSSSLSVTGTPSREPSQKTTSMVELDNRIMIEQNGKHSFGSEATAHILADRLQRMSTNVQQGSHQIWNFLRSRRASSMSTNYVIICHICKEAQEIWARSGAWFYKTLPREQLSSCPTSPKDANGQINVSSPIDLVGAVPAMKEYESDSWVKLQPRRRFSKFGQDKMEYPMASPKHYDKKTSISSIQTSELPLQMKSSQLGHTVKHSSPDDNVSETTDSIPCTLEPKNHSPNTTTSSPFDNQPKFFGSESPYRAQSGSSSSRIQNTPILTPQSYHPAFSMNKSSGAGSSTAADLASSFVRASTSRKVTNMIGEEAAQPITPQRHGDSRISIADAPFGFLYFTLYHDTLNKQLHVAIHKAKNLIAMDANGLSDPYVICQILPASHGSPQPRTSTRPQCLNPVWNEALTFEPFDGKNIHQKTLRFAVLDEDLYGSDWLGEYWLPLGRLPADRLTDYTVPLGPRKPLRRGEYDLACPTRGKIQLGLRYLEDRKQLCIDVIRCSDLASMDLNGLSDPYVKLYLRPDKSKRTKQKTQIKMATLNPEFYEQFTYEMDPSEASTRTLEVTVWDFDRVPINDFIGGLTLGAGAKSERRELWLAVFRPPYRRIEAWFQLSDKNEASNPSTSTPGICD